MKLKLVFCFLLAITITALGCAPEATVVTSPLTASRTPFPSASPIAPTSTPTPTAPPSSTPPP
ncbi:MAG: hypothetical protein L0287_24285, partial [Anaerolineae bacterium]|nr:hypothetical protein [Anaerolineae bacterium]